MNQEGKDLGEGLGFMPTGEINAGKGKICALVSWKADS